MRKTASLVIVALLLASALQIGFAPAEVGTVSARTTEGNSVLYVSHTPIRIDNETDFANQAASEGWAGDGSATNPYVIEGYNITGSGAGIYIGNTTVNFTIRDCYVHNVSYVSDPYYWGASVELYNVSNGLIESNKFWDSDTGVMLVQSSGNEVYNNTIGSSGGYGIYIRDYSENNTVHLNTISRSSTGGVNADHSNGNSIYLNRVSSSGSYGVVVAYSSNVNAEENNISSCTNGIFVVGGPSHLSSPFKANNNTVQSCNLGIYMDTAPESSLFNNTISDFSTGIEIYADSNNSDVVENTMQSSTYGVSDPKGILIDHVSSVRLKNNTIKNIFGLDGSGDGGNGGDAYGVYVSSSERINLTYNQISDIYGGLGSSGYAGSDGNPGSTGDPSGFGGAAYGIYVESSDNDTLDSNAISQIYGGNGGDGGAGGNGMTGVAGASGGDGGDGGGGGFAGAMYLNAPDETLINNTIFNIHGGNGGSGGNGGMGSDGDINSGTDGNGGNGGRGGNGGDAMGIESYDSRANLYSNVIHNISSGDGGNGGSGGDSGMAEGGAYGGNGGDSGDSGSLEGQSAIFLQSDNYTVKGNELYMVNPGNPGLGGNGGMGSYQDGSQGNDGSMILLGVIDVYSSSTMLFENKIHDNSQYCVYMVAGSSAHNKVYHNTFINNSEGAWDNSDGAGYLWDDGYPSGGNYWSDYTGYDNYSGVNQDQPGSDGIGDTEYSLGGSSNSDRYPLMSRWGSAPHVLSTQPSDGGSDIALNENVVVVFNTTMDTSTTPILRQSSSTVVSYSFAGWSTTNLPDDTATWTHSDWNDEESISLEVCNYSDVNGNYGIKYSWSFNTVDVTAPAVISTNPTDSDTGVPLDTNVKVVFDESLNTSVTPQLTEITSSGVTYTFAGFATTNVANDTAIWTHDAWPEKYTVKLKVTGAQDTSGNTMTSAYYWNFTTADLTAPAVISTTPSDGETNVNKSVVITVVFSEEMDTSYNGGAPDLWFRNGTNPGGWVGLGWSSTNVDNDTYSWSHNNFTEKDRISLAVAYYADLTGNVGPTYEWTFYIEDTHAPYMNSTIPSNGEENVNEDINVTVVFSESMNTSMTPVLTQISGTSVNYTFAGWSTTYEVNDTATWTHEQWADQDSISLEVSNYSDPAGNIGANYIWSFTVRDYVKPSVISTDPQDGAQHVPLDNVVTVVFSESMNSSVIPSMTQTGGTVVAYTFLGWSNTNGANDTAMWSHDNWSEKDQITIKISGYRDLARNLGDDYYFTFYTVDLTPPSVASTDPYDGRTQVPYAYNITVVFTESMDTSKIPILTQTGGDVVTYTFAGWESANVANDTAIWIHDNWTDSDTVNLTVSDYYDLASNLGSNYTWSFRVYDTTPPTIASSSPYDGEINVSVSITHVYVNFSEPMDPNGADPTLYISADGNVPQSSFWKWIDADRTGAIFNITGLFSESDHVHMWLSPMQDPYNNNLVGASWWFYTYDPVPPAVNDTNPWDRESPPDIVNKNQTVIVYFDTSLAYINTSVIPTITQKEADPGGWTFLGWDEDGAGRAMASWSHNNWTTETVNLTVSHYRDMCGNWGEAYSWEFTVYLYNSHAMIRINSDAEFASMASSEGWAGDGSPGNPYIIEWYEINGDDGRGGYCIYIGNTTVSFIIRNNSLNYAWTDNPVYPYYPKASVVLYNVMVGSVENNTMNVSSDFGIYALETQNVIVSGNYIHDYWWNAMNIENSSQISISYNMLNGDGNGIYLLNSPNATLIENELSNSGDQNGITFENSSYALLIGNTIDDYEYGIVFDSGDGATVNITMENNSMENCGLMIWGWLPEHWTSHKIVNNTVNNRPLVFLNGVDDAEIDYGIHAGQIYVVDCYNISINDQFIVRATVGVYVAISQHVTIVNSTFGYNSYGMYLIGSDQNMIWHNNFVGNNIQAHDDGAAGDNAWNNSYPYGGNYWDDYNGSDNYQGPSQNIAGSDGIGDSPYAIDGGEASDAYPLMKPTELTFYYTLGWHMVAFPWLVNPTPITDALSNASWDRAMIYLNGTWHTYNINRDTKYNADFPEIDRSMGLWVNFTANSTLVGNSPIHTGNITVYVHSGWNLVEGGLPFLVREVFSGVNYTYVQSANLTNSSNIEDIGDNDTMLPGVGYWVYVDSDYTITINTDDFTVNTAKGIIPTSKTPKNPVLKSAPNSLLSASEASPDSQSTQSQHSQNYAIPLLIIAALGAIFITYIRTERRKR